MNLSTNLFLLAIFISVKPSEDGTDSILLCRVITGNIEQVQPGTDQCSPSKIHYDVGADTVFDPKCYIAWSTHSGRTYIYPEYIVDFVLTLMWKVDLAYSKYFSEIKCLYSC